MSEYEFNPYTELEMQDIEKVLEAKFISLLRTIFTYDERFTYKDSMKSTKIIIAPEYVDKKEPFKTPQIIVSNIGFSLNTRMFLDDNFLSNIKNENGKLVGVTSGAVVPYSLTLQCLAQKNMSRDLANLVANYITVAYRGLFNKSLLAISGLNKSPTRASSQYPEKIFETTLSIQGELNWTANFKVIDISTEEVLKRIDVYLRELSVTVKEGETLWLTENPVSD